MSSQDISNPGSGQSNDISKIEIKDTEKKCSEPNRIPDGGWAWMVVFGSFMCNVVLGNILLYLCMICSFYRIGQICVKCVPKLRNQKNNRSKPNLVFSTYLVFGLSNRKGNDIHRAKDFGTFF